MLLFLFPRLRRIFNFNTSIRSNLIITLVLFAVVPSTVMMVVSFIKYQKALSVELKNRFDSNSRELEVILYDFKENLELTSEKFKQNSSLHYYLSNNEGGFVNKWFQSGMGGFLATRISFFNRNGQMLGTVYRNQLGEVEMETGTEISQIQLSKELTSKVENKLRYVYVDSNVKEELSLIVFDKILGNAGKVVGYIEQVARVDSIFLDRIKTRIGSEILVLSDKKEVAISTLSDFMLYPSDYFKSEVNEASSTYLDIKVRSEPYGLNFKPIRWGESQLYIGLSASKGVIQSLLQEVYQFFFVVLSIITLLIIALSFIVSRFILRPLKNLSHALGQFHRRSEVKPLPSSGISELDLLTRNFNHMASEVVQAQQELSEKIEQLESANKEIKQAQTMLVHSAKMASLGQLVAGIAHELNNPIGFIFSNLKHLKDYSNNLIRLVQQAQSDDFEKVKEEIEFDYLTEDLPRLIKSCEDGAKRTRDIVLGLRNFSRLEEAKGKKISIEESLDNTLQLLSGEIKARITIHKNYKSLPPLVCYASQINQVFMNLLSNAVQAIEGKGEIWLETSLYDENKEKQALITIRDSGKGIAPSALEKIFDPFFTTKTVGKGTGLGLSISYGIIEQHGGDIKVKSDLGKGTEFIVRIPYGRIKED